eukprot:357811-Chlamydomonas_euryale.AAC.15
MDPGQGMRGAFRVQGQCVKGGLWAGREGNVQGSNYVLGFMVGFRTGVKVVSPAALEAFHVLEARCSRLPLSEQLTNALTYAFQVGCSSGTQIQI